MKVYYNFESDMVFILDKSAYGSYYMLNFGVGTIFIFYSSGEKLLEESVYIGEM